MLRGKVPEKDAKVFFRDLTRLTRAERESLAGKECRLPSHAGSPPVFDPGTDRVYRTGAGGRAFLPVRRWGFERTWGDSALVWAESADGAWGSRWVSVGPGEGEGFVDYTGSPHRPLGRLLRLQLTPRSTLMVRVRDEKGRPVPGVRLGLFYGLFGPRGIKSLVQKTETDVKGIGRFFSVLKSVRGLTSPKKPDFSRFFAGFLDPVFPWKEAGRGFRVLEKKYLQGIPLDLILPGTGSLEVRVEKNRKGVVPPGVRVALFDGGSKAPPFKGGNRYERKLLTLPYCLPAPGGKVLFPHLGLGMDLDVVVLRAGTLRMAVQRVKGPSAAGEKVFAAVPFPPKDPMVSLTLLDGRGRPLASREVEVAFPREWYGDFREYSADPFYLGKVRTGKEGKTAFPYPLPDRSGRFPKQAKLILLGRGPAGGLPSAVVDLPPPFPSGTVDLGKVTLLPPPVLVSGRVLDEAGLPVGGARVVVSKPGLVRNSMRGAGMGKIRWTVARSTGTDARGRFSIRTKWRWKRMKIQAYARGHGGSSPLVRPAPALGVELVLPGVGGGGGQGPPGRPGVHQEIPC